MVRIVTVVKILCRRCRRRRRRSKCSRLHWYWTICGGSFNVGNIFRTAKACGVSRIITCGITPHPNGRGSEKVAKSALGSEYLVTPQHFPTTRQALMELKKTKTKTIKTMTQEDEEDNDSDGDSDSDGDGGGETLPSPLVIALETIAASKLYTDVDYCPYYNNSIDQRTRTEDDDTTDIENSHNSQDSGRGIALILGNEVTGVDAELMSHLLLEENDGQDSSSSGDSSSEHFVYLIAIV